LIHETHMSFKVHETQMSQMSFKVHETQMSFKGVFDFAKAGEKMRDLMHEKRLVCETSVLEKRHMKESPIPEAYKRAHCT